MNQICLYWMAKLIRAVDGYDDPRKSTPIFSSSAKERFWKVTATATITLHFMRMVRTSANMKGVRDVIRAYVTIVATVMIKTETGVMTLSMKVRDTQWSVCGSDAWWIAVIIKNEADTTAWNYFESVRKIRLKRVLNRWVIFIFRTNEWGIGRVLRF